MSVDSSEYPESLGNKANLLKFLKEVESMEEDIPPAARQPGEALGQVVLEYVNGARVQVVTTETKLQNSLKDLRISFACVVQATVAYKSGVLKESCSRGRTWIDAFNGFAKDIYDMSMHKHVHGKATITERFMTLLFILFGFPHVYFVRFEDPDDMRYHYLNNTEFQKHLKLVAKYMKRDLLQWRDKNAAQLQWRDENAAGAPLKVSTLTQDLLLDFKLLCNKL